MSQIDAVGTDAILAELNKNRIATARRRAVRANQAAEVVELIEETPGMTFMRLLDSMALEIRELVLSAKSVVLLDYKYYEGDIYARDHSELTVHPLFAKLGIYKEGRLAGSHGILDRERLQDFKAWMRCRYPGLVSVVETKPDPEDGYGHSCGDDFHTIELQRS